MFALSNRLRWQVGLMLYCLGWATAGGASAQLGVLSDGDQAGAWRASQLQQLTVQLGDANVAGPLRQELEAQKRWLEAWRPGHLGTQPMWDAPAKVRPPRDEPVLDPSGLAKDLRRRLLGPEARPTVEDTEQLQAALGQHPQDVGLRQLQLQWLDQIQYRKQYCLEIAETAQRLTRLLDQTGAADEETELAVAFAMYRRVRALAYRELPDVVATRPIEDPAAHEAELVGAYRELTSRFGGERTEFVLIDVRMLRRDRFYGRALELLTDYGSQLSEKWFLKKRRDLLRELGWRYPALEAAAVYEAKYPDDVAAEEAE